MDAGLNEMISSIMALAPLLIFVLGTFIFWIAAFFLLYHFLRFGIGTAPKKIAFVFLAGSLVLFLFVVLLFILVNVQNIFTGISGEIVL